MASNDVGPNQVHLTQRIGRVIRGRCFRIPVVVEDDTILEIDRSIGAMKPGPSCIRGMVIRDRNVAEIPHVSGVLTPNPSA